MSVVYFVRPIGELGPVKIGWTTLIHDRMSALNCWSPVQLEIAATIPGGLILERRFHAKFLASRDHGEWFAWTPELGETIDAILAGSFDTDTLPAPICIHLSRRAKGRERSAPEMSIHDGALLDDVEAFCGRHGIAASAFGRQAAADPSFVKQLRQGRRPRMAVVNRVRHFMATYGRQAAA